MKMVNIIIFIFLKKAVDYARINIRKNLRNYVKTIRMKMVNTIITFL